MVRIGPFTGALSLYFQTIREMMRILIAATILLALCTYRADASPDNNEKNNFGPRQQALFEDGLEVAFQDDGTIQASAYAQQDTDASGSRLSSRTRILLGGLVPGLPQYLDGRPRAWAYFAAEGISIAGFLILNSRGSSYENQYKNLAITARGNFVYPGLRNNATEDVNLMAAGYGEYYEDLLKWSSSGDYDNDPDMPGLQPETNTDTYNGHQWEIARINNYTGTNGGLPVPVSEAEEQAALEAYMSQVYRQEINWDWTGLEAEYDRYHHLFDRSERSYRNRNKFIGVLVANHIVSMLDVLITERLKNNSTLEHNGLDIGLQMHTPSTGKAFDQIPMLVVGKVF